MLPLSSSSRRAAALLAAAAPLLILPLAGSAAQEARATVPGEVTTPHPTLHNLAVEWAIEGDADLDSVVRVQYRPTGRGEWRQAMPLRRVPAGKSRGTTPIFEWKNRHSGSVFDLQPGTEYELRLSLQDPDGGKAERTVRARTRPVPTDAGARIVTLPAGKHDVLQTESGTAERPVVYRSPDGAAVYARVDMQNRKWVTVEGVRVENRDPKVNAVDLRGAANCVVRGCTVEAVYGITARRPGATDCLVTDNVVRGTTPWVSEAMGADGKNVGEGIQLTGPGNVIAYNRVSGFRDCISTFEDQGAVEQACIDIIGNDVTVGADDGIEADFCFHNCRVLRNRLTNCFVGLSSQPGLGGPTYFIRNVMDNLTYVPFKLHRYSQGDVVLHNTVLKIGDGLACFSSAPFDFALFRNNLCVGGKAAQLRWGNYDAGSGRAVNIAATGPHCSFDYDAVGSHGGAAGGTINRMPFRQAEPHGKEVGLDVFQGAAFPDPPVPERRPADLRPRPGSAVVDAAERLPNVNDAFRGRAPDVGAFEAGAPLPHYGPRPRTAWTAP